MGCLMTFSSSSPKSITPSLKKKFGEVAEEKKRRLVTKYSGAANFVREVLQGLLSAFASIAKTKRRQQPRKATFAPSPPFVLDYTTQ